MKVTLSRADLAAINTVLNTAIREVCICDGGRGYLKHHKHCWVHLSRDEFKRVADFLERTRK